MEFTDNRDIYKVNEIFERKIREWAINGLVTSSTDLMNLMWMMNELKYIDEYDDIDEYAMMHSEKSTDFFNDLHQALTPVAGESYYSLIQICQLMIRYRREDIMEFFEHLEFTTHETDVTITEKWGYTREFILLRLRNGAVKEYLQKEE